MAETQRKETEAEVETAPITESVVIVPAAAEERRAQAMRIYVKVAMAGLSGIVSAEQTRPGSAEYAEARRLLMSDLSAVLDGAFGAGCEEAIVYDAHADGRNIDFDVLDARAAVVSGRPAPRDDFFYGLDDSFAALFLVGYRARAESPDALLPQTYAEDIACLRVNESELGEIGVEAALAGKFGVPLAFVSGDAAAVREARELLGNDIETVEVKRAVTSTSGVLLPASRTSRVLRAAAGRAVAKVRTLPPVVFQSPTTLEVVFNRTESADAVESQRGVERVGEFTVRTRGPSILEAYRTFVAARTAARQDASGTL